MTRLAKNFRMVSVVPEELDVVEKSQHLLSWTLNKVIHVTKRRVTF